jgi:hypothetical protein
MLYYKKYKKIKGVVDTIGLVITAEMQAFKIVLLIRAKEKAPRLQGFFS